MIYADSPLWEVELNSPSPWARLELSHSLLKNSIWNRKMVSLQQRKKSGRHQCNQMFKVNITSAKSHRHHEPLMRRGLSPLWYSSLENHNPRKTWESIRQVHIEALSIKYLTTTRESCQGLGKQLKVEKLLWTKETWWPNATWYLGLGPGTEKGLYWKNWNTN